MRRIFAVFLIFISCSSSVNLHHEDYPSQDCIKKARTKSKMREISSDEYTLFQGQEVRVYLASVLAIGNATPLDSFDLSKRIYQDYLSTLGTLFRRGLLTGEMFYQGLEITGLLAGRSLKTEIRRIEEAHAPFHQNIESYNGKLIKILGFWKKRESAEPSDRTVFRIDVTPHKYETGMGIVAVFELILKSKVAYDNANSKKYFETCELVCLKYSHIEL